MESSKAPIEMQVEELEDRVQRILGWARLVSLVAAAGFAASALALFLLLAMIKGWL